MREIKGNVLTAKNVLKAQVRNSVKDKDTQELTPILAEIGYEYCDSKNAYVLEREDDNGVKVYTVLTMTVSTKHPSELATRKAKPKAKETETIEID